MRVTLSVFICLALTFPCHSADWLRFRGPNGSGIAETTGLPATWDDQTNENISWRADLPGRGLSCPIIVGDRIFLTCCTGFRQDRLHVLCLGTENGDVQWERQIWATGRAMTHPSISTAAPTPVSDGERVYVYFSTNDVACFDLDGNLQWFRGLMLEFPNASNSLGLAASPLVLDGTLVVPIENETQSVALGLDAETGETRWKLDRPKSGNWTSPIAIPLEHGKFAVALQSSSMLTVHEAASGEELWRYEQGCSTQPSSVTHQQVVYLPSGGLTALKYTPGAATVLWQNARLGASTSTPLVHQDRIFTVSGSILKCAEAETGRILSQLRLKGSFSASPVTADGHIYLFNSDGLGHVVELKGNKLNRIGGGDLAETILSSPAIAGGALYVRSDSHLWKISEDQ